MAQKDEKQAQVRKGVTNLASDSGLLSEPASAFPYLVLLHLAAGRSKLLLSIRIAILQPRRSQAL